MSGEVGESQAELEARLAALLQYASLMGPFYKALTDQSIPSPMAQEIVTAWWEHALGFAVGEME